MDDYLRNTLIVCFAAIFIIVNLALLVCMIIFLRREQDMALSRIRYFFAKPYIIEVSKKGNIRYFNRTWKDILDKNIKYKNISQLECVDVQPEDVVKAVRTQKSIIVHMVNGDNEDVYIRLVPLKVFTGFLLIGDNVTQTFEEHERNEQIALYNSVTNLPNRYVLDSDIKKLVEDGSNYNNKSSLVGVNILDFVKINKMFGFSSGDRLLREGKKIIEKCASTLEAKVYNIRTSLFMVLIEDCSDYKDVITFAQNIIEEFKNPIEIKDNYQTIVEVKLGIYNIDFENDEELSPKHIYECAYSALERANNSRFTHYATYNYEFGNMLTREQVMEQDLFKAIKNDEFIMFYQPQYNSTLGKIVGFEALVRWNNPKYLNENVEHYVSIAEKNGVIIELGNIIIEKTFAFAKRIENTGIHVSINVSPAQLLHSGFVNTLLNYFDQYKLRQSSIAIEITETFLMENSNVMIEKLRLLKERGFDIHLDDFGIGYSSMMYLKDLPINTIKIDKEFTRYFLIDKFSRAIVTRVAQLALSLDLKVIVEGVENEKQMTALNKIGCDVIQGYLISKAVDTETTLELIKKYNGITIEGEALDIDQSSNPIVKEKERKAKNTLMSSKEASELENESVEEMDNPVIDENVPEAVVIDVIDEKVAEEVIEEGEEN